MPLRLSRTNVAESRNKCIGKTFKHLSTFSGLLFETGRPTAFDADLILKKFYDTRHTGREQRKRDVCVTAVSRKRCSKPTVPATAVKIVVCSASFSVSAGPAFLPNRSQSIVTRRRPAGNKTARQPKVPCQHGAGDQRGILADRYGLCAPGLDINRPPLNVQHAAQV